MFSQAFAKLVKMEQEQAEKERQKEEEERKRKREMAKRRKRMLEAAFDGDNDEINTVIKEVLEQFVYLTFFGKETFTTQDHAHLMLQFMYGIKVCAIIVL